MTSFRSPPWALAALALGMSGAAQASPYRVTGLGAADTWELKLVSKYDHDDTETKVKGAFDITAPLAPGLETSVTFGRGWLREPGMRTRTGWIDTEIAVKWEILPLGEDGGFGITTEPALFVPTGTRGIADHEWQVEVPLVVGYKKGPAEVRGLVGYARSLDSGSDEISYGAVGEYDVNDRLSFGAELSGGTSPDRFMREYEVEADIGFKFALAEAIELQGRIGQSLRNDDHMREHHAALYVEIGF